MSKHLIETMAQAMDAIDQAETEFDLGIEFVHKEVVSAAENDWIVAYVAGMAEEAIGQLLLLTEPDERLEMVGELQALVLHKYMLMEVGNGEVA